MVYFTYPESQLSHMYPCFDEEADSSPASKVTLEEISVIFDGKHAVHNDILAKQEEQDDRRGDQKGSAAEHLESNDKV